MLTPVLVCLDYAVPLCGGFQKTLFMPWFRSAHLVFSGGGNCVNIYTDIRICAWPYAVSLWGLVGPQYVSRELQACGL